MLNPRNTAEKDLHNNYNKEAFSKRILIIEDDANRKVDISLLGVDKPFYDYMDQLIVQAEGNQGPFQTPSATVRGNIINITDIDTTGSLDTIENSNNFALGYFAVCETFETSIILK